VAQQAVVASQGRLQGGLPHTQDTSTMALKLDQLTPGAKY
jgi:hypothetical protein